MIQSNFVEQALAQQSARLRVCLQQTSGNSHGPEEGSDAWLLLHDLSGGDHAASLERFEQSGHWLAEQQGKLDARLQALQRYVESLARELQIIFSQDSALLVGSLSRLYTLQSDCSLALTRGYQSVLKQAVLEKQDLTQQYERSLLALQRINGVSNSNTDLDQTLVFIAETVAAELGADLCTIYFYDELQRMLTLRATNGPRPLGGIHFTLRLGEGYSGWVADKGQPLLVRDVLTNPHFAAETHTYSTEYHGLIAVPIIFFGATERLIGVISIQSIDARDFTTQEKNFIEVIAGIIAINIENGRLYEQTDEQLRRKVHELATIHRVTSIIASTLDLNEVLQIIATQAVHLSGAERSCIFGLELDDQRLTILAHYGLNSALAHGTHLSVGQCCGGRTVETGAPQTAFDCIHNDSQCFLAKDPGISAGIHSVLCVPLRVKQKILGCICLYGSQRHQLSPEQMQLVITFANEAAIAIENARLYDETRRGLELKSMLLRELHHRVKNNLATVAGILSLQQRRTKSLEVQRTLAESVNRVQGLAATHDLLAHEDLSEARVDEIARKIVGVANANLRPPETHIIFEVEPCPIVISSRAVTILALVLNELVSNAIKHGMVGLKEGRVTIRGFEAESMVVVQVIDNGPSRRGSASNVRGNAAGEEISEGLGVLLIKNLIGDLRGTFSLRRVEGETYAEVRFPPPPKSTAPTLPLQSKK